MNPTPQDTPCRPWKGRVNKDGYGIKGRQQLAHRWVWATAFGPVPPGMNVLHRCDNPPCINPDHLFLGTQADNMRDKIAKGHAAKKLTAVDVGAIRTSSLSTRKLGTLYGVSNTLIWKIKNGMAW